MDVISCPPGERTRMVDFWALFSAHLELDYFKDLYQKLLPAPDYSFSLFRNDGMLLARAPTTPAPDRQLHCKHRHECHRQARSVELDFPCDQSNRSQ